MDTIERKAKIEAAEYAYRKDGIDEPAYDEGFYFGYIAGAKEALRAILNMSVAEARQFIANEFPGLVV